jgi:hypothetical protein
MPYLRRIFMSLLVVVFFAGSAFAAPFTVIKSTDLLVAPAKDAPKQTSVEEGAIVEVTHQAGNFWRVELGNGKTGYVPAASLRQTKTKGLFLVPIVVAAATPIVKIVVAQAVDWFKQLFGLDEPEPRKADDAVPEGNELTVLARESGGWLKVKDESGKVGYIKESPRVVYLQPVSYADRQTAGIWKNSEPIPSSAAGLTLQVEVRKIDGTPVPPNGTLKLGDEYLVYITPSADAYVRITCETPDFNHTCQYYPNHFPGTQTSMLFKGGNTYSTELLPQGVRFKVSEPIGAKDILRIEATTAGPYHYVAANDGCAPTVKFKGGGFSTAGAIINPTAQVIIGYEINITK